MQQKYHKLEEMLEMIEEPNKSLCHRLFTDNKALWAQSRAAKANHQPWEGGYMDHVTEVMNLALVFYEQLKTLRPLPFSLSDALLVLYLHDVEKPWKYELINERWELKPEFKDRQYVHNFAQAKIKEYGFVLSDDHQNGLMYVEGEIGAWTPGRRTAGPFTAFTHLCDYTSARLWFDHPLEKEDPWAGAKRIKSQ